ncbi:FxSxx-COOH system tetratricopeptide repeat protein [Actinosynnema sp. CS-041913]|uniref:FxSxx-COOH system tetratricopeptide repeat protein n=1 Tax=Actinosynnema sp. CS-041913 TaxID=3239917 RepID=UPI003D8A8F8D
MFLSHTSELGKYPVSGSFVAAVEKAVLRVRDVPVDMEHFTAGDLPPAELCRARVAECDVFVLVAGFRYGSPVPDRPEVSYTELEFEAATDAGLSRLVFLVGEDAEGPLALFRDEEFGARQEAFRRRLPECGLTVRSVSSPAELESAVVQALTELPRSVPAPVPGSVGVAGGAAGGVWNVPARLVGFTGREDLLGGLERALDGDGPVVVLAIAGMGGVGKTSTAIEYAHRHAADYDVVWWVPAERVDLVPQRLADLARSLGLAQGTDAVDVAVARALGHLRVRPRSLLVFDNAEHPDALRPYLPGGAVRVIVTSRNPHWAGIATPVPVDAFTPAESLALLADRAPGLDPGQAGEVAEALGHLPSALDQAAALLAGGSLTARTYLRLLRERADELLRHRHGHPDPAAGPSGPSGPSGMSVAASWSLAFDALADLDPAGLQLLTLLAWLAPEPFPHTLLPDHTTCLPDPLATTTADPLALAATLDRLHSRALARVIGDTIHLHRVPAALLRTTTAHDTRALVPEPGQGWAATALHLLHQATPDDPWYDPTSWPVWRRLLPHVLTATATDRPTPHTDQLAELLRRTSAFLTTLGQPAQALPHSRRAHTLAHDHHGADHPDTLHCAHRLAIDLAESGEHQAARGLDEDTLARRRRVLGHEHPDTLRSAQRLAVDLAESGQHQTARGLDEDTLARRRRVLGDEHPDTLWSAHNLAANLSGLGKYQAARGLDEDTLARRRRVLGDEHPDTLCSAHNLAINLSGLGEHQAARELDEDTLARRRRVLGHEHPDTLRSAHRLAIDLAESGMYQAARGLDEDTLARRRRVLGDEHPDTLWSAHNLAANLSGLGKYQAARELDEDTLARRRRVLGDEHPDTLSTAHNLAVDLWWLGEYQAARGLNEDTLARRRRVLGDEHPDTLSTAHNLAVDLSGLGEHQTARGLNEDTLARRHRVLGDEHPDTLRSAHSLAADLSGLGEHQTARELDEDTLARRRRVLGDEHPDTLRSAHNLAADLSGLGEHQTARELDEDTLARRRRVLGDEHPDTLSTAHTLVHTLRAIGQHSRADALQTWINNTTKP